jgi:cystathionine gamma-lyase
MASSSVSQSERDALGISDGMVRLSVGIEDEEDLIADIDQALKAAVWEGVTSQTSTRL